MKQEKFLPIPGGQVYYYTTVPASGLRDHNQLEKPLVVLIHGFGEDASIWEEQVKFLAHSYPLLVLDIPGSGRSDMLPEGSMEIYAGVVNDILEQEAIKEAVIIGHSMGGYISLAFAALFPSKLKALCLFHSSAYADDEEKINTRRKGIEFIKNNGSKKFLAQAIPNLFSDQTRKERPELISDLIQRFANFKEDALVQYYEAMIARPDRTDILRSLDKPIFFIAGRFDAAVPLQNSLAQSTMPSFSYIHVCKNSGHMGMLEETNEVNSALEHFLQDL